MTEVRFEFAPHQEKRYASLDRAAVTSVLQSRGDEFLGFEGDSFIIQDVAKGRTILGYKENGVLIVNDVVDGILMPEDNR